MKIFPARVWFPTYENDDGKQMFASREAEGFDLADRADWLREYEERMAEKKR